MRLVEELPFSLAQLQLASEYENVEEEEIETGNQIQVGKKPKVRTSNEFGTTLRRRKPRKDAERIDEYDDDEFDSELDDSDLDSMELSEERERRETANSEGRFIKIFGMRLYYGRRPRELLEEEEDEDSGDLFGIYSDSEDFDTEEGERYSSDQDSLADREDPRDSSFGAYGARSNDDEDHRLGQTWQSGGSLDSQHDMAPRGSLEIRADAPSYEVEGPASYDDAAIVPDSYQSDHHLLESQRGTPTKGNEPKLRRGGGTVKLAPRNTLLLESVEKVQDKRARRKRKADYIYFFAYAQAQQSIIEEIEMLAQLVRKIVGGIEMAPLMIPEDFMGGMGTTPGGGSSTSAFRRASTFVPPIPAPPPVAEITGRPGRRSSILSMRDDTNSTAYGAYRNRADMRSVIGGEAGINLRDVEVGMRDGFGRR
ncbi:hypothetical protein BJ742DRAFT_178049 [Cladochytrium replicatum]|nr:hypothetical protein BJ742DRAFT_178049 [Cladochytrium replicatum]